MDAIERIRETERAAELRLSEVSRQLDEETARRINELKEAHQVALGLQIEENRQKLEDAKAYLEVWNQRRQETLRAHAAHLEELATERFESAIALVMERLVE